MGDIYSLCKRFGGGEYAKPIGDSKPICEADRRLEGDLLRTLLNDLNLRLKRVGQDHRI